MRRLFLLYSCAFTFSVKANCQNSTGAVDSLNQKIAPIVYPTDTIFSRPEIPASFPGGTTAWLRYIMRNLIANQKAPGGTYTVSMRFVVDKKGKLTDFFPETNHGYGMEEEVIRILENGPKWKAAKQSGQPVNSYQRQSVVFVVEPK